MTDGPARGVAIGLALSAISGSLLFLPRAATIASSAYFQTKMLLLVAAAAFHFLVYARLRRRSGLSRVASRATGALEMGLWLGVVSAGAAFILLE